jgi:hypothetical protein
MAEEWWLSADGGKDAGHRDRTRVLRSLAEQALAQTDHFTVAAMTAPAVDTLIATEPCVTLATTRLLSAMMSFASGPLPISCFPISRSSSNCLWIVSRQRT